MSSIACYLCKESLEKPRVCRGCGKGKFYVCETCVKECKECNRMMEHACGSSECETCRGDVVLVTKLCDVTYDVPKKVHSSDIWVCDQFSYELYHRLRAEEKAEEEKNQPENQ